MLFIPLATVLAAPWFGQSPPKGWPSLAGGVVWVSSGVRRKAAESALAPVYSGGRFTVTLPAPGRGVGASVEFLTVPRSGAPLLTVGENAISYRDGKVVLNGGAHSQIAARSGPSLDLLFVIRRTDLAIYANGQYFAGRATAGRTKISFVAPDWETSLEGLATFSTPLSPAQIVANANAARAFAEEYAVADPFAVVEAQLGATTAVPDPNRIKPYRNALLAQDYRVLDVVSAGVTSLKAGDRVRVFRYGIIEGKPTGLKDLKVGDRVRLRIEPMTAAAPGVRNEYQLDDLDTSFGPVYVEVPKS